MSSGVAIFFLVIVLLPMIPALVLYRLLPSQADVEGPWHGLKIKLTGAFGGYFLLVVTLLFSSASLPTYDVWTVQGQLQLADQPNATFDENVVRFTLKPAGLIVQPNGRFSLTLFRIPDQSGESQLPIVIVDRAGYIPVGIDLEEEGTKSARRRQVVLSSPIRFVPAPTDEHGHQ